MAEHPGWRDAAFELYRQAWFEIHDLQHVAHSDRIAFYIEELKEALLDLKQATIASDQAMVRQCSDEILVLLIELRGRSPGE